jgi:hypothetical protein
MAGEGSFITDNMVMPMLQGLISPTDVSKQAGEQVNRAVVDQGRVTTVPAVSDAPREMMLPTEAPRRNVSAAAATADDVASMLEAESSMFGLDGEKEEEVVEAAPVAPADDIDADLPDTPAAENFRKLRDVVKNERKAKKELQAALDKALEESVTVKTNLEKYEKGEAVPEVLRSKDERIAELEKYEQIHALERSPHFQANYVKPAIELRGQLEKLGNDYGVPAEVMHQAAGISNKRQRNQFLSRYFDDIGGLEVAGVMDKLHALGEKIAEVKQSPKAELERLKMEAQAVEVAEAKKRGEVFEVTAKESWNRALEKTKQEGVYKELILHPTNTEYNEKVVKPIQHKAATEYGKLVRHLNQLGLKELPSALADGLARMVQLSVAGAMALQDKERAESTAKGIMDYRRRTTGYIRPSIGGSNGTIHSSNGNGFRDKGPTNPREAAEAALRNLKF